MEKSVILKKGIVFTIIFSAGLIFLYLINFIWVISVLILLGISLGISGIPSERIAPYPADAGVSWGQKIRRVFKE